MYSRKSRSRSVERRKSRSVHRRKSRSRDTSFPTQEHKEPRRKIVLTLRKQGSDSKEVDLQPITQPISQTITDPIIPQYSPNDSYCTSVCRNTLKGCKNRNCRFAHSFDEFRIKESKLCAYKEGCIKHTCKYVHPGEEERLFNISWHMNVAELEDGQPPKPKNIISPEQKDAIEFLEKIKLPYAKQDLSISQRIKYLESELQEAKKIAKSVL